MSHKNVRVSIETKIKWPARFYRSVMPTKNLKKQNKHKVPNQQRVIKLNRTETSEKSLVTEIKSRNNEVQIYKVFPSSFFNQEDN